MLHDYCSGDPRYVVVHGLVVTMVINPKLKWYLCSIYYVLDIITIEIIIFISTTGIKEKTMRIIYFFLNGNIIKEFENFEIGF